MHLLKPLKNVPYTFAEKSLEPLIHIRSPYWHISLISPLKDVKRVLELLHGKKIPPKYFPIIACLLEKGGYLIGVPFNEIAGEVYEGNEKKTKKLLDQMVKEGFLRREKAGEERAKHRNETLRKIKENEKKLERESGMKYPPLKAYYITSETEMYSVVHARTLYDYLQVLDWIKKGFNTYHLLANPEEIPFEETGGNIIRWELAPQSLDEILSTLQKGGVIKKEKERYVYVEEEKKS
jgi:DNA-binding PadR family transcriptional regulator